MRVESKKLSDNPLLVRLVLWIPRLRYGQIGGNPEPWRSYPGVP